MHYRSYLLRLWLTHEEGKRNWRIAIQNTETTHRENFTSLEELLQYIQNDIDNSPVSALAEGEGDADANQ